MGLNLYTFFVYFGIVMLPAFIFVYISGGSYLKMRLKSKLPWFSGKGKNLLHFDKTGTARWDYVILRKGNIINKGDDAIRIEGTHHSLIDATRIDKHTTIHQIDKEPLIITVEGSPTNVLVQQRNYDEDISKLSFILKRINDVIATEDQEAKAKLQKDLLGMFNQLLEAFKYLDPARKICYYTIKKTKEIEASKDEVNYTELLEMYKMAIQNILSLMKKRTMTMINFTDYFTEINLSRIFNSYFKDANQLGRREALIGIQKENNIQKIGGILIILGMLFIGYMVYDMSGKMKAQTESMSALASSIDNLTKSLIDPDTNQLRIPTETVIPNTPIEGNPIVGGGRS